MTRSAKFIPSFKDGLMWNFGSRAEAEMYRDKLRALGVSATATPGSNSETDWYIEISSKQLRDYFKQNLATKAGLP